MRSSNSDWNRYTTEKEETHVMLTPFNAKHRQANVPQIRRCIWKKINSFKGKGNSVCFRIRHIVWISTVGSWSTPPYEPMIIQYRCGEFTKLVSVVHK